MLNSINNVPEIHYIGAKKVRRSDMLVKIQYEGHPSFVGFFYLPTPLRKEIIRLNTSEPTGELVLTKNQEGKWSLIHSSNHSTELMVIPNRVFLLLEMEWLMPTQKSCPVHDDIQYLQSSKRKAGSDFLWLKYHDITFYGVNIEKMRKIMRGIVSGKYIFPDDERLVSVYRTPEQYIYSRDGVTWNVCPNDMRHLYAPRRCIFAVHNR